MEKTNKEDVDSEEFQRKSNINTLDRRMKELQKFKKVNKYLIGQFEKELNNLK